MATARASTPRGQRASQSSSANPSAPSLTITEGQPQPPVQAVLHLRGATREEEAAAEEESGESGARPRRRIQWAEDVVDNEGLGRKSSKGMVAPFFEREEDGDFVVGLY